MARSRTPGPPEFVGRPRRTRHPRAPDPDWLDQRVATHRARPNPFQRQPGQTRRHYPILLSREQSMALLELAAKAGMSRNSVIEQAIGAYVCTLEPARRWPEDAMARRPLHRRAGSMDVSPSRMHKPMFSHEQGTMIDIILARHRLTFAQLFELAMSDRYPGWPTVDRTNLPHGRPRCVA